jgi:hypothetical protein
MTQERQEYWEQRVIRDANIARIQTWCNNNRVRLGTDLSGLYLIVAEAIEAEREACAKIADDPLWSAYGRAASGLIAQAIRNRGERQDGD